MRRDRKQTLQDQIAELGEKIERQRDHVARDAKIAGAAFIGLADGGDATKHRDLQRAHEMSERVLSSMEQKRDGLNSELSEIIAAETLEAKRRQLKELIDDLSDATRKQMAAVSARRFYDENHERRHNALRLAEGDASGRRDDLEKEIKALSAEISEAVDTNAIIMAAAASVPEELCIAACERYGIFPKKWAVHYGGITDIANGGQKATTE